MRWGLARVLGTVLAALAVAAGAAADAPHVLTTDTSAAAVAGAMAPEPAAPTDPAAVTDVVAPTAAPATEVAAPTAAPTEVAASTDVGAAVAIPETIVPTEWLPETRPECFRSGHGRQGAWRRRRFCDGPRRVPLPTGEAAEQARALGLGTRATSVRLLTTTPRPEWIAAAGGPATEVVLGWPVDGGRVWRDFGVVRRERVGRGRRRHVETHVHQGVDIGAREGTHVLAAADGIVAYSDTGVRGYGNVILVVHPNGWVTLYGHCAAAYVFPGQRVVRGQVIGEVGETGLARGSHLHFELREGGHGVRMLSMLVGRPAER